jgi:hypothetical protein
VNEGIFHFSRAIGAAPDCGLAYQLTPYDPAFEKKVKQAEDIIGRYRNTLHTLAK